MPEIEYRNIPDFPGYRVGSDGSVHSRRSKHGLTEPWRKHKPTANDKGYLYATLRKNNRSYKVSVARTLLAVFVGPCPPGMEACHNNGVRWDNRLENLRWDTRPNNQADRVLHGTSNRGERQGSSKLKEADVLEIRRRYANGETQKAIADDFGIYRGHVSRLVRQKRWAHLCAQI